MMEYFNDRYPDTRIRDQHQPLLVVHKPDENIYLPSELCQIPNLPDDFTKDRNAMRDLQQFKSFDPDTRIGRIQEMGAKLK